MTEKPDLEVINLIAETVELDVASVTSDSSIESLGLDSIKFMNLLIGLEDIIGKDIEDVIEDVDFAEIKTVSHIIEFVNKSI